MLAPLTICEQLVCNAFLQPWKNTFLHITLSHDAPLQSPSWPRMQGWHPHPHPTLISGSPAVVSCWFGCCISPSIIERLALSADPASQPPAPPSCCSQQALIRSRSNASKSHISTFAPTPIIAMEFKREKRITCSPYVLLATGWIFCGKTGSGSGSICSNIKALGLTPIWSQRVPSFSLFSQAAGGGGVNEWDSIRRSRVERGLQSFSPLCVCCSHNQQSLLLIRATPASKEIVQMP